MKGMKVDAIHIPGLRVYPRALSEQRQAQYLASLDALPWCCGLKRRVQQYGYRYAYRGRIVDGSVVPISPMPAFALALAQEFLEHGMVTQRANQMIVNEYLPGQGIAAHIDSQLLFDKEIVTASLGSSCEMDFIHKESGEVRSIMLLPGYVLVLRGEARCLWRHRIRARRSDHGIARGRRVSLTFRRTMDCISTQDSR